MIGTQPSDDLAGGAGSPSAFGLRGGLICAVLVVCLAWAFAGTIRPLWSDWQHDDNYSVGQLVPFAALYLVWCDRKRLGAVTLRPCWWGAGMMALAAAFRVHGLTIMLESVERYAFVLTVIGLVLLVAGKEFSWRAKWILLFLFLMVPLPGRVHNMISGPLQNVAARGAVMMLELIGIGVSQEGNVMVLNDRVPVAVAEACSGLRMLTAFIVVAFVMAYLANRPNWQKVVLVLSSVPVAIVCNLIRLVVTALLFLVVSSSFAEKFFHDFAGWTMMPLAVLMLLGELWLLSRLVVEDEHVSGSTTL